MDAAVRLAEDLGSGGPERKPWSGAASWIDPAWSGTYWTGHYWSGRYWATAAWS